MQYMKNYEKNINLHTDEQLRYWAHLEALEKAPDRQFWRKTKQNTGTPPSGVGVSPGKRINLRGQCVDQLQKWHELLESGAIDNEQEFKNTLMDDMDDS